MIWFNKVSIDVIDGLAIVDFLSELHVHSFDCNFSQHSLLVDTSIHVITFYPSKSPYQLLLFVAFVLGIIHKHSC